jgi:serine phosphatase RsbU (regulator of sigma subunit)
MRIAVRLGAAFAVVVALAGALGWLWIASAQGFQSTTRDIAEDRFAKVVIAERGVALVNENARLAIHLFALADPAEFDRDVQAQAARSAEITAVYEQFERAMNSNDERVLFDAVKAMRQQYVDRRAEAERELRAGDHDAARTRFDRSVAPALAAYIGAWDAVLAFESHAVGDAAAAAAARADRAKRLARALVLAALVVGVAVAAHTIRRVTAPVLAIARAAERIERGERDVRVPVSSTDEVGALARAFNVMGEAVAFRQDRLEREMTLAQHIQTALLPRSLRAPGLEIAAAMRPATEVSGDYYDVLPTPRGCWIGIGDVAGHGLDAGLIMIMIQSGIAALVRRDPEAAPRSVLAAVNRVLYENLRERLQKVSHATLTLLCYREDGLVTFAGAHEPILVWRARSRRCEVIETPGTWLGGADDIEAATTDSTLVLSPGDVFVLYTDGLLEALDAEGTMFGLERLRAAVEEVADRPVDVICARVLDEAAHWASRQSDDRSVLVARFGARDGATDSGP